MYDILIKNGKIVDGTGIPAYHADVAIVGEKIVAVGSLSDQDAKKTIDQYTTQVPLINILTVSALTP